jgi:hypothetical protein
MAYNVENLFDTEHDADRVDFTYLPLAAKKKIPEALAYCAEQKGYRRDECLTLNWDESALDKKIKSIASGVLQVYSKGPDILILEEVENLRVLKILAEKGLGPAGYTTQVLLEGWDKRGIDIGVLSRFPLAGDPKIHEIEFRKKPEYGTRGIIEVPLKLPNDRTLFVFGLHLPSQANPTEQRIDAVNTLTKILKAKGADAWWVVGGDWNITGREDDETGLISKNMAEIGHVSHIVGCSDCRGTHNYQGLWDFLDILVFSKQVPLVKESIWTPKASPLQLQTNGKPARFNLESPIGISDHLPIYGEIQISNPETEKK